jgi:hypothetical protein
MLHGVDRARHPALSFAPDTVTDLRDLTPLAAASVNQSLPLMNEDVSEEFLAKWIELARSALPDFREKVAEIAPVERTEVFGVKLTGLLPELIALSRMTELDAKFIIMSRDPRDIFASALKRYGDTDEAYVLAFMNAALSLDYEQADIPNSMSVSYEELVADPQTVLTQILDFVGLSPRLYDWEALANGLISNSSFAGIGPDDVIHGAGIQPSIGQHEALEAFYKSALAEFFRVGKRGSLRERAQIYDKFLPLVIQVAARYGYSMTGLKKAAEQRRGIILSLLIWLRFKD